MSEDRLILGIPALRENPFQARPLEMGQSKLLVGREDISATWVRFLKTRNARMVLLIGESGSGKTSLLRCVSEEAGKSVHLDMFPSDERAYRILHEIHSSIIGFEIPSTTQELVSRLVSATEELGGPLPLITLDYSNADGKSLAEVTANLISPLERLNAMVVVVLSTEQRAQWPESLVNQFDHFEIIKSLERDEIKELCESRMATAAKIGWDMPEDVLDYVMGNTNGMPTKVMRTMRDLVDEERANPRDIKFEKTLDETLEDATDVTVEQDYSNDELPIPDTHGFDLDLDELEKEPVNAPYPSSVPAMGSFGSLVARNRVNKTENPPFIKTEASKVAPEPEGIDPNRLWVADHEGASLIIEEIEDELLQEEEYVPEEPNYYEETEQPAIKNSVDQILGQLMDAINAPKGLGLADLLAAIRRPMIGQKESNPLDVQTLRNLSRSEAILIEVGSDREFSPSDARLQDKLEVKRPRMSQMCNRLYRAGIMSVQQKGRTRMFKLTNDARAQLVAWGMMEASI
tara:strand:+ start:48 stop:1601 length:1554 start_codon:yes stop_codon:yes gene_type:complete